MNPAPPANCQRSIGTSNASTGTCRQEALVSQIKAATTSAEVAHTVQAALEAPGVLVFGELLDLPRVQQLAGTEYAKDLELLKLFAYGTLRDYKGNESAYPPLTEAQLRKLRQLSVASLAAHSRSLPYAELMEELGLSSRRELEDLVIEAIYAEVVKGKLDQRNACFQVDQALARDVSCDLSTVSRLLADWCSACEAGLGAAERAAERADGACQRHRQRKVAMEERADAIRQSQQDRMSPEVLPGPIPL